MKDMEKVLSVLRPISVPLTINGYEVPSIGHCVGTGKLIGQYFGDAICEECELNDDRLEIALSEVSCLLRSYIVLDDFVKDCAIEIDSHRDLREWIGAIPVAVTKEVSLYTTHASAIWDEWSQRYEVAYRAFDKGQPFRSVIEKCCLIFLPFGVPPVSTSARVNVAKSTMEQYLFALQLLDDFHDMEEDAVAKHNHNLFLAPIDKNMWETVMALRSRIIRSLLEYIAGNLLKMKARVIGPTTNRFLDNSLEWIALQRKSVCALPFVPVFDGEFHRFRFTALSVSSLAAVSGAKCAVDLSSIRAENMHTVMS